MLYYNRRGDPPLVKRSDRDTSRKEQGVREMSKSKEELNKIKEEVEVANEKLQELTPEEIAQVNGGVEQFGFAIRLGPDGHKPATDK